MLADVNLSHCLGCYTCFLKGEEYCPIKDDATSIEQQMHDADGVIFASPVYGMNVSGLFKMFVDRFSYIFHRPCFFDKKALLITTAGGIGQKEVLKYMDLVASVWGFDVVNQIGLMTPAGIHIPKSLVLENEKKLKEAADKFQLALQRKEHKSPSLYDVLYFRGARGSFEELGGISPRDYEYWKGNGWFDKRTKYFVDVPINPIYNILGSVMEIYVRHQIRKLIADGEFQY